jgi:hypothetical protein
MFKLKLLEVKPLEAPLGLVFGIKFRYKEATNGQKGKSQECGQGAKAFDKMAGVPPLR